MAQQGTQNEEGERSLCIHPHTYLCAFYHTVNFLGPIWCRRPLSIRKTHFFEHKDSDSTAR